MTKKANGRRTIPQIFFDDYHVGGYQELRELEKAGNFFFFKINFNSTNDIVIGSFAYNEHYPITAIVPSKLLYTNCI